jgi:hypothetical protein
MCNFKDHRVFDFLKKRKSLHPGWMDGLKVGEIKSTHAGHKSGYK